MCDSALRHAFAVRLQTTACYSKPTPDYFFIFPFCQYSIHMTFDATAWTNLCLAQGGEDLRKAAKCPLCYSMVAARELKLVQIQRVHVPQVKFNAIAAVYAFL